MFLVFEDHQAAIDQAVRADSGRAVSLELLSSSCLGSSHPHRAGPPTGLPQPAGQIVPASRAVPQVQIK